MNTLPVIRDSHLDRLYPGLNFQSAMYNHLSDGQKTYLSLYTDSLAHLAGYNHPQMQEYLIQDARDYQNGSYPLNEIDKDLKIFLGRGLREDYLCLFSDQSPIDTLADSLSHSDGVYLCFGKVRADRSAPGPELIDAARCAQDLMGLSNARELFEKKTLNRLLTYFGREVRGVILSPIQTEGGDFLFAEQAQNFEKILRKAKIPLIMDERETFPMRTGARFYFEWLNIQPDVILSGGNLYGNKNLSVVMAPKKKAKKRFPALYEASRKEPDASLSAAMVTLKDLMATLDTPETSRRIEALERRMGGKLRALAAHSNGLFSFSMKGSLAYLQMGSPLMRERVQEDLKDQGILVGESDDGKTLLIAPPLSLEAQDTDDLIYRLEAYFRDGLRLSKKSRI